MLISAALFSFPTALLGLVYKNSTTYEGLYAEYIWWHMWFGILLTVLAMIAVYIRESKGIIKTYYAVLCLLFIIVNITAMLGGSITFGS
ncbi:MAG: hypothetical protein H0W88_06080 [Parachlamydiaceae bacterium]|nr:hypothetical protein [Parachlamydiaceae bacterium]